MASKLSIPIDMRRALDRYRRESEYIVEELAKAIGEREGPDVIYHYTDGAGLLGILAGGTIRLTDMFGLNDPSELRHGVNHARSILTREAPTGHPAAAVFAKQFDKIMSGELEQIAHFFVACFSGDSDELGQWRAYGDNGKGFAIGFDRVLLERGFVKPFEQIDASHSTFPMSYDDKRLMEVQATLATKVIPLMAKPHGRRLQQSIVQRYMMSLSEQLGLCVLRSAIFFKHEAYKHESEFRFLQIRKISDPLEDLKHRARGNTLIRFTEFSWKHVAQTALRVVVLGPANHDEVGARAFIKACIEGAGLGDVPVEKSRIPYR